MIEYDDERPVLEASIISLPRTKQLETAGSGLQALEATWQTTEISSRFQIQAQALHRQLYVFQGL
eukprot:763794-Hanusia_phi.AAC.3